MMPNYIEERIRKKVPMNSCIIYGSTPVVSFGNSRSATVATLGLNPSRLEFLDRRGTELIDSSRRLSTHRSLGITDLSIASSAIISQVVDECDNYFYHNPYHKWFNQLELILNACNVSYYDGSACHLDLVQWATDPTWGKLQPATRYQLLQDDKQFLLDQLANENIRLLLVNGRGVWSQLQFITDAEFKEHDRIETPGRISTQLYTSTILGRVSVVAWSTNLQSSRGVTKEQKSEIARRVAEVA
jgi:hypothetical protein